MSIFIRDGDLKDFFKRAPVTSIIIIIVTMFLAATVIMGGFTAYNLLKLGGLYPPFVKNGDYYRLLTTMFLHGSYMHFLANTIIGLYVLSSALERLIGSNKFAFIYFVSGLVSSVSITFMTNNLTIGASGAIYGALGSLLYITIYRRDLINVRDIQSIRGLIFVNIIFTFLIPGISIIGHIGGLLCGYLLSYILVGKNTEEIYY